MNDIKKNLKIYLNNNLKIKKSIKARLFDKITDLYTDEVCDYDFIEEERSFSIEESKKIKSSNINDFINEHNEYSDFQTMLFKFIDNKNLKDSDVYNKVHIDRRLFSKIRSDKNYHPSKETIILLAISLELNEIELEELLDSASYSLPKNNKYDLIIRFCFINRIFKLTDINELLLEHKCKLFNY